MTRVLKPKSGHMVSYPTVESIDFSTTLPVNEFVIKLSISQFLSAVFSKYYDSNLFFYINNSIYFNIIYYKKL